LNTKPFCCRIFFDGTASLRVSFKPGFIVARTDVKYGFLCKFVKKWKQLLLPFFLFFSYGLK